MERDGKLQNKEKVAANEHILNKQRATMQVLMSQSRVSLSKLIQYSWSWSSEMLNFQNHLGGFMRLGDFPLKCSDPLIRSVTWSEEDRTSDDPEISESRKSHRQRSHRRLLNQNIPVQCDFNFNVKYSIVVLFQTLVSMCLKKKKNYLWPFFASIQDDLHYFPMKTTQRLWVHVSNNRELASKTDKTPVVNYARRESACARSSAGFSRARPALLKAISNGTVMRCCTKFIVLCF